MRFTAMLLAFGFPALSGLATALSLNHRNKNFANFNTSAAIIARGTVPIVQVGNLGLGARCDVSAYCGSGWCALPSEIGHAVPNQQKICRLMPFGGPCTDSAQCATGNCNPSSSTCGFSTATPGACQNNMDCRSGVCIDQQCKALPGAACSSDDACASGACSLSTCAELGAFQLCLSNQDCASGQCVQGPPDFGLSWQDDGSLVQSDRAFPNKYCMPSSFGVGCSQPDDCETGLYCSPSQGVCTRKQVGAVCGGVNTYCKSNLCGVEPGFSPASPIEQCLPLPPGYICAENDTCGSKQCNTGGHYCLQSSLGEPCFWNADCPGLVCDRASLTCVDPSALPPSPSGTTTEATPTATSTASTTSTTSTSTVTDSSTSSNSIGTSTSTTTSTTSVALPSATSTSSSSSSSSLGTSSSSSSSSPSSTSSATPTSSATTTKSSTTSAPTVTKTSSSSSSISSSSTAKSTSSSNSSRSSSTSTSTSTSKSSSTSSTTSKASSTSTSTSKATSVSSTATPTSKSTSSSSSSTAKPSSSTSATSSKPGATSTSASKTSTKSTSTSTKASSSTTASRSTTRPVASSSSTSKTVTTTTTALLPLGSPCPSNAACKSQYCRAKLNADGTRSTAKYCDVKKASGADCYQSGGCLSGICIIAKGAVNGKCK